MAVGKVDHDPGPMAAKQDRSSRTVGGYAVQPANNQCITTGWSLFSVKNRSVQIQKERKGCDCPVREKIVQPADEI